MAFGYLMFSDAYHLQKMQYTLYLKGINGENEMQDLELQCLTVRLTFLHLWVRLRSIQTFYICINITTMFCYLSFSFKTV